MNVSELIELLCRHEATYGDTCVAIRHTATHEFGPDDNLLDILAGPDEHSNLFVIRVEN